MYVRAYATILYDIRLRMQECDCITLHMHTRKNSLCAGASAKRTRLIRINRFTSVIEIIRLKWVKRVIRV